MSSQEEDSVHDLLSSSSPTARTNTYQLEAQLRIHQVQAIEQANLHTERVLSNSSSPLAGASTRLVDKTSVARPMFPSLADDLSTEHQDDDQDSLHSVTDDPGDTDAPEQAELNQSNREDDDDDSISQSLLRETATSQQQQRQPQQSSLSSSSSTALSYSLHDSNSSGCSGSSTQQHTANSPRNVSRRHRHRQSQAKKQRPDDLENIPHEQLQQEVKALRQTVQDCYRALVMVQRNADAKLQQVQLENLYLERKLADEQAITSKLSVSNTSLRRELQAAFVQAKQAKDSRKCRKMVHLHQRELTVEKHLNSLLQARNQAVKQNTTLKRMLLQTCTDCRNQLPLKKSKPTNTAATRGGSTDTAAASTGTPAGGTRSSSRASNTSEATPRTTNATMTTPSSTPALPRRASSTSATSSMTPHTPQQHHDSTSLFSLDMSTPSMMTPRLLPEMDSRPTWQTSQRSMVEQLSQQAAAAASAEKSSTAAVSSPLSPNEESFVALPESTTPSKVGSTRQQQSRTRQAESRAGTAASAATSTTPQSLREMDPKRKQSSSSSLLPPRSPVPHRSVMTTSTSSMSTLSVTNRKTSTPTQPSSKPRSYVTPPPAAVGAKDTPSSQTSTPGAAAWTPSSPMTPSTPLSLEAMTSKRTTPTTTTPAAASAKTSSSSPSVGATTTTSSAVAAATASERKKSRWRRWKS